MRTIFRLATQAFNCELSIDARMLSILILATMMSAIPQTIWAQVQLPGNYDVCPGVGVCDYESPDAAVNDPARVDGDIIEITTDTYVLASTLQVDDDITINGNGSILDADGFRGVEVAGLNTVFINDLTISNAQRPR